MFVWNDGLWLLLLLCGLVLLRGLLRGLELRKD